MGKGAKKDKKCKKKDKRSSVQSRGQQLPLMFKPAALMESMMQLQQQQAASSSSSVVKAFIKVKLERFAERSQSVDREKEGLEVGMKVSTGSLATTAIKGLLAVAHA